MLFDLEDYNTTMRATNDQLRQFINWFGTPQPFYDYAGMDIDFISKYFDPYNEPHVIPTAEQILDVNRQLRETPWTVNQWGIEWGGADSGIFGEYLFEDFMSTANATRDALMISVESVHYNSLFLATNEAEFKANCESTELVYDAFIELGPKWKDFWSACLSFAYYAKGLTEGDALPNDMSFGYSLDGNWYQVPVKFKIMTQAIYDDYFEALQNFMQSIKNFLIHRGFEA
jgi:hypothetical protein